MTAPALILYAGTAAAAWLVACSEEPGGTAPLAGTAGSGGLREAPDGSAIAGGPDGSGVGGSSSGAHLTSEAPDGCDVPPGSTALCLTFAPERIAARPEAGLDQRGFFTVQVFATASPPAGEAASAAALYERTVPAGAGEEMALGDLPEPTIVFTNPPSTVFVRAIFFDNGPIVEAGRWGTWLGGIDLSRGLSEDAALLAVSLREGEVTRHEVPLVAFRRLKTTVTTSVDPIGDGEGALSIVASRDMGLPPDAPTHGYGIDPCVDLTRGPQTVEMVLLGSGTFFVTGYFDDLGIETPGQLPPGTLLSVDPDYITTDGTTRDTITVADDQYAAELTIDLAYLSSVPEDPSALGPNSCADLGLLPSP